MSISIVKPSLPSVAFDGDFVCGTPTPGLPPKPQPPVPAAASLRNVLNANRGSAGAASIVAGSGGTKAPNGITGSATSDMTAAQAALWVGIVNGGLAILKTLGDAGAGGAVDVNKAAEWIKNHPK